MPRRWRWRGEIAARAAAVPCAPPSGCSSWRTQADAQAILLAESTEQAALIGAAEQVEAVTARLEKRAAVYADPAE